MPASARSSLALFVVALALAACSDAEEAPHPAAAASAEGASEHPALYESGAVSVSASIASIPGRAGRRAKSEDDENVAVDVDLDEAKVIREILGTNLEDEGGVNRALLRVGAGFPPTRDGEARRSVDMLEKLAKNERAVVRRGAVALLARVAHPLLVGDPFTTAMLDSDAGVRRQAVIGRIRHGAAQNWRTMAALAQDPNDAVRAAVAQGLGVLDEADARAALAKLVLDPSDVVVDAAAASLANSAMTEPPPAIVEAARSPRPAVRRAAAIVLGETRSESALRLLSQLAGDEAATVRKDAIWSASNLGGDAANDARALLESIACDAVKRPRGDRFEALQGLARTAYAPDAERLVAVATKDKDSVLRAMAARTLMLRGDARGVRALADLLDARPDAVIDDEDACFVRRTADEVLSDVAGAKPRTRSVAEWKRTLPDIEARLPKERSDTPPARVAQLW